MDVPPINRRGQLEPRRNELPLLIHWVTRYANSLQNVVAGSCLSKNAQRCQTPATSEHAADYLLVEEDDFQSTINSSTAVTTSRSTTPPRSLFSTVT